MEGVTSPAEGNTLGHEGRRQDFGVGSACDLG